ncbi:hypothetical protein SHIRM173S_10746 [Streptomyces hirsutus]
MRVPRLVGLMAVDARESARARGLYLEAPDRPDFHLTVVEYVVRQYPQPGAEVPRDSLVHVWVRLRRGGRRRRRARAARPVLPGGGLQRGTGRTRRPRRGRAPRGDGDPRPALTGQGLPRLA